MMRKKIFIWSFKCEVRHPKLNWMKYHKKKNRQINPRFVAEWARTGDLRGKKFYVGLGNGRSFDEKFNQIEDGKTLWRWWGGFREHSMETWTWLSKPHDCSSKFTIWSLLKPTKVHVGKLITLRLLAHIRNAADIDTPMQQCDTHLVWSASSFSSSKRSKGSESCNSQCSFLPSDDSLLREKRFKLSHLWISSARWRQMKATGVVNELIKPNQAASRTFSPSHWALLARIQQIKTRNEATEPSAT